MSAAVFHFNASAHLQGASIRTDNYYHWGVRALHVDHDRIIGLGESYEEMKMTCSMQHCLRLIKRTSFIGRGQCERGEVLARTLTANLALGFQTPEEERKAVFRSYLAVLKANELVISKRRMGGDGGLAMRAAMVS
jgi:hypothetical protein